MTMQASPTDASVFPNAPQVLVVGLGAIGTVVAGRLLAAPCPPSSLRVLAPDGRTAAYRATPPSLNGTPLPLPPEAYVEAAPAPGTPRPDLLLVAVKGPALSAMFPAIAAWTAPHTTILSLLNGISAPRMLGTAVPPAQVVPAIVTCNTAMRTGRAVEQHGLFRLDLGPRLAPLSPGAAPLPSPAELAAYLATAPGLSADAPADFADALWLKFVLNVGLNQAEALLSLDHGQLLANPDARAFCHALMVEAAAVAAAEGLPTASTLVARAEALLSVLSPRGRTSMLQDIDAGRPHEIDLFAGEVLRLAARHQLSAPANQLVLDHLAPS